jgi:4-hydroxybenzoate polyprenyltransferase
MFPIAPHVALASLTYLSIAVFAGWTLNQAVLIVSWSTLLGVWSILGLWLILRLMDELKDQDIDRDLFSNRPLPSGRVFPADIKRTLAGAMILYITAHWSAGTAFWTALFVLAYAVLMFKRFFAPRLLRDSLILTLVTHNPIVPLMLAQGFAIFAAQQSLPLTALPWHLIGPFIVMMWAPFLAWELARKIRSPEEENAYVTYSRLFGPLAAVAITAAIQTIGLSIGLYFWRRFFLSWVYMPILTLGWALSFTGHCRFALHASPRTAKLKGYAVAFLVCTELAQLIEFGRSVWRIRD